MLARKLEVSPMKSPFSQPDPPIELAVVGENRDDPSLLLLLGIDEKYYAYSLSDGDTRAVEPDDHWDIQPALIQNLFA
jgi:hypothetical protein